MSDRNTEQWKIEEAPRNVRSFHNREHGLEVCLSSSRMKSFLQRRYAILRNTVATITIKRQHGKYIFTFTELNCAHLPSNIRIIRINRHTQRVFQTTNFSKNRYRSKQREFGNRSALEQERGGWLPRQRQLDFSLIRFPSKSIEIYVRRLTFSATNLHAFCETCMFISP